MQNLNINSYAQSLSLDESCLSGSAIARLAGMPFRCALVALEGFKELLCEPIHHPLSRQPRVIMLIIATMMWHWLAELTNWRCYRSLNLPRVSDASVYTRESESIAGFWPLATCEKPAHYYHANRECCGASLWFAGLFHALEKRCPDPEQRLRVVSELYSRGVPKEAVLIQATGTSEPTPTWLDRILGGVTTPIFAFSRRSQQRRLIVEAEGMLASLVNLAVRSIREAKNDVSAGTYLVRRGYCESPHEMVYIKISDKLSYTFDPDAGLTRHQGVNQWPDASYQLGIANHQSAWLMRVAPRAIWDRYPLDLSRRLATLFT